MLTGPQGPPWWIFFEKIFKNVLVYPQLTQKYVLWHSKLEKSILGSRELYLKCESTGAFNQEKAPVGAFSVITNLRMDFFESLLVIEKVPDPITTHCNF